VCRKSRKGSASTGISADCFLRRSREGEEEKEGSPSSTIAEIEREVHYLYREFFYRQTNLSESCNRVPVDCYRKSRIVEIDRKD